MKKHRNLYSFIHYLSTFLSFIVFSTPILIKIGEFLSSIYKKVCNFTPEKG